MPAFAPRSACAPAPTLPPKDAFRQGNLLGVSPAFVFSRYGTGFSVDDFCAAAASAAALGFRSFQPEVYHVEALNDWLPGGARRLDAAASGVGLTASQCVAHFLMGGFSSPERLASLDSDLEAFRRFVEITTVFRDCRVLTVPIGPFRPETADACTSPLVEAPRYRDWFSRLAEKVAAFHESAVAGGLQLALEILSHSLLANADGFLRLHDLLGKPPSLGVNLDTGHAWAQREVMEVLPWKLQGCIFGTHLKDNDGNPSLALVPGRGTLPWRGFLEALLASGYNGGLDLEIVCPPDHVDAAYTEGRSCVEAWLNAASQSF